MSDLAKMLQVNLGEGLGPEWERAACGLAAEATALGAGDAITVATDGRMMPHEWLRTQAGLIKADAVDHADDHFFPRDQDIAWDVAGFAVEFALSQAREREMAEALAARIGDRYLPRRVPFYRTAYLAYQLGYAELASTALAGDAGEARRFRRRADGLRMDLRARLAHLAPSAN
jgi:hypothetical protein